MSEGYPHAMVVGAEPAKRSLPSHQLAQEDQNLPGDLSDPSAPPGHLLLWVLLVRALPVETQEVQDLVFIV